MENIRDLSWMQQLLTEEVIDRFSYKGYRAVAVKVRSSETKHTTYHLRLLFFPAGGARPVLAVNLESTILGSCCITEHVGPDHHNLQEASENMSYSDFKERALETAHEELDRSAG